MAFFQAKQIRDQVPVPSANAATDVIPLVGDFTIPTGFATNDVVEMVILPAGYVPVDVIVDHASAGTTVTSNAGLLSGVGGTVDAARTCGAEFMSAQAFQTAGIKRMAAAGGGRIAPTTGDRGIGFVSTSVSSPTVGAAIRMTVLARPQSEGV
jgi:hypothetical protein